MDGRKKGLKFCPFIIRYRKGLKDEGRKVRIVEEEGKNKNRRARIEKRSEKKQK
jgi:hypothetical protein